MDNHLNFYEISSEYISYLLKFDGKIPHVDYSAVSKHSFFVYDPRATEYDFYKAHTRRAITRIQAFVGLGAAVLLEKCQSDFQTGKICL